MLNFKFFQNLDILHHTKTFCKEIQSSFPIHKSTLAEKNANESVTFWRAVFPDYLNAKNGGNSGRY